MSECFDKLDEMKSRGGLGFDSSVSPHVNRSVITHKIAMTLSIPNKFMKEVNTAYENTGLSYVNIMNSQITYFQFVFSERLEARFKKAAYKTSSLLKTKCRSGRKRQTFLSECSRIAVYEHELCDIKQMSCTLDSFEHEQVQVEQKCAKLYKDLQQLRNEHFEVSLEHSHMVISENKSKKTITDLSRRNEELSQKNEELESSVTSMSQTVNDVRKTNTDLKLKLETSTAANGQLHQYICKLEDILPRRTYYDKISTSNKARQLRTIKSETEKALWFSEYFGLTPTAVQFKSTAGEDVRVRLNEQYTALPADEKQKLKALIYILDKFAISDAAYHELSMMHEGLPRKYLLVQERSDINNIFHIERTPGKMPGAYVSIHSAIASFIRRHQPDSNQTIQIKVAGDGAKVSRISNFVTFTISFPEHEKCASVNNIRTIAIVKCRETYDDISICCSPILKEFNELLKNKSLVVDDKEYQVQPFFNGDMKFIQICMGLSGATANFACPWCMVKKEDRTDLSKDADFYESSPMKRTLGKMKTNAETKSMGSKAKPLLDVEPSTIVPDELHLFVRIADILLQNLMDDCRQQDDAKRVLKQKGDHMDRLVKVINGHCGVNFHIWTDTSGQQQYTSLTGGDYKKLFRKLPYKLLFIINNDTHDTVSYLWQEFNTIHEMITKGDPINKTVLFLQIKHWMDTFLSLERKGRLGYGRVTPYMHCLLYHVPTFAEQHNGIGNFTGQGVEKMNDDVKSIHQKRCNRFDPTMDEMKTRKRMEHLMDQNLERTKNKYTKSNQEYWLQQKGERRASKRRKIESEISEAHETYQRENEISVNDMTTEQLKQQLKSIGVSTKIRKRQKLINLLNESIAKFDNSKDPNPCLNSGQL